MKFLNRIKPLILLKRLFSSTRPKPTEKVMSMASRYTSDKEFLEICKEIANYTSSSYEYSYSCRKSKLFYATMKEAFPFMRWKPNGAIDQYIEKIQKREEDRLNEIKAKEVMETIRIARYNKLLTAGSKDE